MRGMYCGRFAISSAFSGAGISIDGIASALQSSNSSVISVNTLCTRTPMIIRFASRNSINPRLGRIVLVMVVERGRIRLLWLVLLVFVEAAAEKGVTAGWRVLYARSATGHTTRESGQRRLKRREIGGLGRLARPKDGKGVRCEMNEMRRRLGTSKKKEKQNRKGYIHKYSAYAPDWTTHWWSSLSSSSLI
jgi:hypothetical protein